MTQAMDLIILGAGPAGMSAAIYAARANMKAILLDISIAGGLVNSTHTVENYPAFAQIHGMELMEKMQAHVHSLNVPLEELCEVEALSLTEPMKTVTTSEAVYQAPAIILATGRTPIALDVPTECENIHFCSVCDGASYAGKNVLVVGGGNSAFDESLYLLSLGVKHITLVEVMDTFFAAQKTQEELLQHKNVTCLTCTKVHDLVVNESLQEAILENTQDQTKTTIPVDGVFVFLGQKPNNNLCKDVLTLDNSGYIVTDADMQTNISGVYAAGDIVSKKYRQIVTAVSDGAIAALSAEKYVRSSVQKK